MSKQVRNILITALAVLAIYTICGFFLVPYIAKSQMQKNLQTTLGSQPEIRKISFNPFTFRMKVEGFKLPEADSRAGTEPRLQFEEFSVQLAIFPLFKKELRLNEVFIKSAQGKFLVFKDGKTNWVVTPSTEPPDKKKEKSEWVLTLQYIQIDNSGLKISDFTHVTPLELPLGPFSLRASNISTSLGSETSLRSLSIAVGENGHLKVNGGFSMTPLSADLNLDIAGFPLDFMTAYLSDKTFLILKQGNIDLLGNLKYNNGDLTLTGNSEIHDLNLSLPEADEPAIAWKNLKLNGIQFNTKPLQFHVPDVDLIGLQTTIVLQKDGSLNYKKLLRPDHATPAATPPPANSEPAVAASEKPASFDYLISKLNITTAAVSYSDLTIKPSFSAHVHNINGSIGPISPQVNQKINIDLKGQIETYGKFSALGNFTPGVKRPSLDLGMGFNNIEMTTFTPYSGHFAGY